MIYKNYEHIITTNFSKETYNDIINKWNEPHRFYHNIDHLNYLIETFEEMNNSGLIFDSDLSQLIIVAFFHDVVYNPKKDDNEEKSVEYFVEKCKDGRKKSNVFIEYVSTMIMDTKYRKEPKDKLSKIFWKVDNSILKFPVNKLIEIEHKIFMEYQWVSYDKYKEGRIEFLESCLGTMGNKIDNNLNELIKYVRNRVINVGIYAGSFNPFHIGHYNIFKKSEKIFDKVIVAFGVNPDKEKTESVYPGCLEFTQKIEYDGLVTTLLDDVQSMGCSVTLLRGIRNGADLSYESNQLSFINDIRPNTSVIYIPSDKKYEHVSSSAIRSLMKFDENLVKKYLV